MNRPKTITYDTFTGYQCLENIQDDAVDLCLITCGIENCAPLHSFTGVRDLYIFHFITKGVGYVEDSGSLVPLSQGDVFLIEPGKQVHYIADKTDPWSYMWVGFRGIKAQSYIRYAGYHSGSRFGHMSNISLVNSYIQQIITNRAYTRSNDLKRHAALFEILALMIDEVSESDFPKHDLPRQHYIELAKAYIADNYQHDLQVSDIAARIGIDRSYLTQVFKDVLHISPQEYILQFRMNRAALLLHDSSLKVSAIAHEVGYKNVASFSRMFCRYKGVTPAEYRLQLLANAN